VSCCCCTTTENYLTARASTNTSTRRGARGNGRSSCSGSSCCQPTNLLGLIFVVGKSTRADRFQRNNNKEVADGYAQTSSTQCDRHRLKLWNIDKELSHRCTCMYPVTGSPTLPIHISSAAAMYRTAKGKACTTYQNKQFSCHHNNIEPWIFALIQFIQRAPTSCFIFVTQFIITL
jgi:hypothetical protein